MFSRSALSAVTALAALAVGVAGASPHASAAPADAAQTASVPMPVSSTQGEGPGTAGCIELSDGLDCDAQDHTWGVPCVEYRHPVCGTGSADVGSHSSGWVPVPCDAACHAARHMYKDAPPPTVSAPTLERRSVTQRFSAIVSMVRAVLGGR